MLEGEKPFVRGDNNLESETCQLLNSMVRHILVPHNQHPSNMMLDVREHLGNCLWVAMRLVCQL